MTDAPTPNEVSNSSVINMVLTYVSVGIFLVLFIGFVYTPVESLFKKHWGLILLIAILWLTAIILGLIVMFDIPKECPEGCNSEYRSIAMTLLISVLGSTTFIAYATPLDETLMKSPKGILGMAIITIIVFVLGATPAILVGTNIRDVMCGCQLNDNLTVEACDVLDGCTCFLPPTTPP